MIIDAILDGSNDSAPRTSIPKLNLEIPAKLNGIGSGLLDPRDSYPDASQWESKARDLAKRFIGYFSRYTNVPHGKMLVKYGPATGNE